MRLRIISDGTPANTYVVDDQNCKVENMSKMTWQVSVGKPATCTLELLDTPSTAAAAQGPEQVHVACPLCEVETLVPVAEVVTRSDYLGTETRIRCHACGKASKGELWFDTSGMN